MTLNRLLMFVLIPDTSFHRVSVEFAIALLLQVGGIITAVVFIYLTALMLELIGKSMSWFTSTWLLFGIYFSPFVLFMTLPAYIYIRWKEDVSIEMSWVESYTI